MAPQVHVSCNCVQDINRSTTTAISCVYTTISVISGFHRALLQSITFISRLMHSIIQNLEVKIYVV